MNSRNYGCRITSDVIIKGNKVVIMENNLLKVTILADRGTDIIELLYKPLDIDFMWRSPVRLHKKSEYISSNGDSLGNYLDHNSGGWQEILPSGGGECYYKGACIGMHGEVSNVPWNFEVVCDTAEKITVAFEYTTLRSPFHIKKYVTLLNNDSTIYLEEELTNLANEDMELMWGHHPTIGEPFLSEHCKIQTTARTMFTLDREDFDTQRLPISTKSNWPVAEGKDGTKVDMSLVPPKNNGTADMVYLTDFAECGMYEIINEQLGLSMGMKWDKELFPYMWMWLVCNGSYGYPWYGRTYNLALEPWTSYSPDSLPGAIKNGSALVMKAQETIKTKLEFFVRRNKNEL